ncbi:MAG: MBL fold hydrolase [Candidatus Aminicenantes bacterium RBG_13_59_9]|nr:MAG: MBL fold hydrolase [Candidatus Aminicenantes bacterium RBG_13_59_9]
MKIQFLGASQQVTGSSYFVEAAGLRLLVDCGLYQERAYLERNWIPFPVSPESLDFVLLTHVHLDHSGLLPKLIREGFRNKILMTPASADLLPVVLLDSAQIQEEDAAQKKKRHQKEGRRARHPEVPLYTTTEAERVGDFVRRVPYEKRIALRKGVAVRFREAGHILGSASIDFSVREGRRTFRTVFSGDLGQPRKPLIRDPAVFEQAQTVVMESTYGDRDHEDPDDTETMLGRIIRETASAGGNVVIPVFAVERAQEMMFHLSRLIRQGRIPRLPVFLDSPMATDVTAVFLRHQGSLDKETIGLFRSGQSPFQFAGLRYIRSQEESKALNGLRRPAVIMAGSGMCTGGRIKHHLLHNISRPESTLLFVGYQAEGTLGRQITTRPPEVRIFGQPHPLKARVQQIHGLSGHADRSGLVRWVGHFQPPRPLVFLTHGENEVAQGLARYLREERHLDASVPGYRDLYELKFSGNP